MRTILFIMILEVLRYEAGAIDNVDKIKTDTSRMSVELNIRRVPGIMRYADNYNIISSVNSNWIPIESNYSIQKKLDDTFYSDSTIRAGYTFLQANKEEFSFAEFSQKDLLYGTWRNNLTQSKNSDEIVRSVTSGTRELLDHGYSDFARDFLPFIAMLMEENHMVTYDFSRTRGVGKGSKGIVQSHEALNALHAMDPSVNAGVCRDIHDAGREILAAMGREYYSHFFPQNNIDIDDHIFLQSWTTDASQHVTLSFIDPFDRERVYEIDWGRVIEKNDINGYDNGRLYGNTFRIWKYDDEVAKTVPVDFRRTRFGKILDYNILSSDEYMRFNGLDKENSYSSLTLHKNNKRGSMNISLGSHYPFQRYLMAGWKFTGREKGIGRFFNHSFNYMMQSSLHEDTRKKQLLYPEKEWMFTSEFMIVPRAISKIKTARVDLGASFSLDAFFYQQLDVFLLASSFTEKNGHDFTHSGDANLSFSNGFNINYLGGHFISGLFSIQARSCILPGDIRLMTPNISGLIPALRFVTPAVDAILNIKFDPVQYLSISMNSMFEFTNLNTILYSGKFSIMKHFDNDISLSLTAEMSQPVKGLMYFWYPVMEKTIDMGLSKGRNSFSVTISKYSKSDNSTGVSLKRYFN